MVTGPRLVRVAYLFVLITLLTGFSVFNRQTAIAQQAWTLPSPWSAQDIGNPAIPGSATANQGTFTITAQGSDIWGQSDQFNFVYQQIAGDVEVIARVDSVSAANSWSKTGVMIRSSLAADAAHGYAVVSASKGVAFQRRLSTGTGSSNTYGPSAAAPYWVKLVRKGNAVTAYSSANGTTWTTIASSTIALGSTAYVGIATTSHSNSASTTVNVSQVSVNPLSLPSPQKAADIGAPTIAGSTAYSQGVYSIHAGGTDIWGTSDQFHFVYQPMSGDGEVVARVSSITNSDSWAKAGVMIRETLAADSRNAFALLSVANGYALQSRIDPAGISQSIAGPTGTAPGWVRLVRSGTQMNAYKSVDGTTWTLIGSDAVPMVDPVYVGIAVTSHNATVATDAVVDNFKVTQGGSANQPPSVAITSPADGTSFTAGTNLTVTAAANDSDGTIARVNFFAGTTQIGSATSAPYSATWSNVAAGTYSLTAVAVDNDGASTTSAAVSVRVDPATNKPPTVSLTAPANGASYTAPATVTLSASASDTDGTVAKVEFYNGSTLLATDTATPYSYTWSSVPAGSYGVRAVAYDDKGASASSATATITVAGGTNQPPTVSLTAPANGATYTAPATISLTATAADSDGTISKVEFYNGTTLLNSDTTAPYSFSWSNVAAGTYSLTAKAYDSAGATATSAAASVTVAASSSTGLIGAYALNEGSGTVVANSSGSGPAGTMSGATWTAGKYGQALSFSGTAGEVSLGDLDFNGSFTISGWLQLRSLYTSGCGSFVVKSHDYGIEICNGQLGAAVAANSVWVEAKSPTLTNADLNVWKYVTETYDGTTVRLYINGALISSATSGHTSTANPLIFGHWTAPDGEYWNGLIDEVRLYSRALSAAEIQTDMNTPIAGGSGNIAPTVSLTSPTNGSTFTAPASVTLSANATDADGTIAKVEFYNGTTLLATDTTSPYTFAWSSVAAGTYTVKAIAYDNSGASTSSATSTITVSGSTTITPTGVIFAASPDHATLVTSYELRIYASGANPSTATPIAKSNLGKPTPDANNDISVNQATFFSGLAAGNYVAAVAAIGSGGSSVSAGVTFTR